MSWQSTGFYLGMRLIGLKHWLFGSPRAVTRTVKRDRRNGPARPSARMRDRFEITEKIVDGLLVTTVAPKGRTARRVVVYLHGGGFIMQMTSLHWGLIARLARRLDAVVIVPEPPLVPEHTAVELHAWLLRLWRDVTTEHDARATSVMGDSSGGHLALALAKLARKQQLPLPSSLVLFSPALTGHYDDPQRTSLDGSDCMIALAGLPELGRLYAGDLTADDPLLDLLAGSLSALPPTLLFSSTREIMHFDAQRFREKAKQDGADVVIVDAPGLFHVWPIFPIPEAEEVVDTVSEFLDRIDSAAV